MPQADIQHNGVTHGNLRLYKALIRLLGHVNIKIVYAFMRIFIIPVTMILSPGARLTYDFFHRIRGYGRWKSICYTYRNHCVFGETVIDKFAMYAGHHFKFTYYGQDVYDQYASKPEPLIQLNAHIGCCEILGYSYHTEKRCNILVFGGENVALMDYRKASFEEMNMRMIPVGIGTNHSEEMIDALDRGEILSVFADRYMNINKVIVSTLFGHEVNLARGPFSLATTRGIDVVMVSAMKEKDGSYSVYYTPLQYDKTLPLKKQRQQLADAYAAEIERLINKYPYQWFNYFNPWRQ